MLQADHSNEPYSAIQFVINSFIPANAPAEIVSRGIEALGAYNEAVAAGSDTVYRTRLMLVGQERVGKTSLVKNLLQLQ